MKLFQINLPKLTNRGVSYSEEHARFCESVLDIAGGYTRHHVSGLWRDGTNGDFYDESIVYQIACKGSDVDTPNDEWDAIVARAKRLFSDQICLFVAELGEAQLV